MICKRCGQTFVMKEIEGCEYPYAEDGTFGCYVMTTDHPCGGDYDYYDYHESDLGHIDTPVVDAVG